MEGQEGYHNRSRNEVVMYRFKTAFGPGLNARKMENQKTETNMKAKVLTVWWEHGKACVLQSLISFKKNKPHNKKITDATKWSELYQAISSKPLQNPMLIRIVRMTFDPDKVEEFQKIFEESKEKIRTRPGCRHLELWRDLHQPHIFVTHSHWDSEQALNAYRESELFVTTWKKTKALFSDRALAFSVIRQI